MYTNPATVSVTNNLLLKFNFKGGPYATFAGRDASRNLATFSVDSNDKDDYDDLSDLTAVEMDSVREWEMQFKGKVTLVFMYVIINMLSFYFV